MLAVGDVHADRQCVDDLAHEPALGVDGRRVVDGGEARARGLVRVVDDGREQVGHRGEEGVVGAPGAIHDEEPDVDAARGQRPHDRAGAPVRAVARRPPGYAVGDASAPHRAAGRAHRLANALEGGGHQAVGARGLGGEADQRREQRSDRRRRRWGRRGDRGHGGGRCREADGAGVEGPER